MQISRRLVPMNNKRVIRESMNLFELTRAESLHSAERLLKTLRKFQLNIVTAESLTAGNIAKTLVDIPTFGANIYGGFIVYDTAAKREWLNVTTPSVYSEVTARQMAIGALRNSRAMVSVAVTGNAGPVLLTDLDALGMVDIGVAVRIGPDNKMIVNSTRKQTCQWSKETATLCDKWKLDLANDTGECVKQFGGDKCSTIPLLQQVRNVIRNIVVIEACNFANQIVQDVMTRTDLQLPESLAQAKYDKLYLKCGEPSSLVRKYLGGEKLTVSWPKTALPSTDCPKRLTGQVPTKLDADQTEQSLVAGHARIRRSLTPY